MEISKTSLDRVSVIKPPTAFEAARGVIANIYKKRDYREAGVEVEFVQETVVSSPRHVLRGIHGDNLAWRMVSCLFGRLYLVVVDWDGASLQRGKWESFVLSDRNRLQVLIPPKFCVGHLVLSEHSIFLDKRSAYPAGATQFSLAWNDPSLDIWWPVKSPLVAQPDQGINSG